MLTKELEHPDKHRKEFLILHKLLLHIDDIVQYGLLIYSDENVARSKSYVQ